MKLSEELSTIRQSIRQFNPSSKFEDSYLYSIWIREKARVVEQEMKRQGKVSPWMYHRFCIELQTAKAHDCNCVNIGCDIKKTKYKIPDFLSGVMNGLQILTLDNKRIGLTTAPAIISDKEDRVKSKEMRAVIYNQYVEIYNAPAILTGLQLNAIWGDILAWQDIQLCTDSNPCKDIYETEMGLPLKLSQRVHRLVLETLGIPLSILDDVHLDKNPNE